MTMMDPGLEVPAQLVIGALQHQIADQALKIAILEARVAQLAQPDMPHDEQGAPDGHEESAGYG